MLLSVSRLYSVTGGMITEYAVFGGIRIDRGNQSTQRKCAPVPLCPPTIPHNQARDQIKATVMERR
jgi:hypothetical protein